MPRPQLTFGLLGLLVVALIGGVVRLRIVTESIFRDNKVELYKKYSVLEVLLQHVVSHSSFGERFIHVGHREFRDPGGVPPFHLDDSVAKRTLFVTQGEHGVGDHLHAWDESTNQYYDILVDPKYALTALLGSPQQGDIATLAFSNMGGFKYQFIVKFDDGRSLCVVADFATGLAQECTQSGK